MLNASRSFSDPPSLLAKSAHFCIQQNHTFRTLSFSEARKPFVCCENYRVYTNNSQLGTHAPAHHDLLVFSFHTLAWNPFCNPFVFTFMHRMGGVRAPPCASFLCVPLRLCVILFPSSASAILFAVGSLQSAPHPEIQGAPCSRCA